MDNNIQHPSVLAKLEAAAGPNTTAHEAAATLETYQNNTDEAIEYCDETDEVDFKASSLLIALRNAEEGEIPRDAETVLVVNQTLQELVAECLRRVDSRIDEVSAGKSALEGDTDKAAIGSLCGISGGMDSGSHLLLSLGAAAAASHGMPGDDEAANAAAAAAATAAASVLLAGGRLPQLRLASRAMARCPFFSATLAGGTRLICPPNADGATKRDRGELCLSSLITLSGSGSSHGGNPFGEGHGCGYGFSNRPAYRKKFLRLVAENFREKLLRPLLSRQAGIAEQTKTLGASSAATNFNLKKSSQLDREIRQLRSAGVKELLERLENDGPNGGVDLINFDNVVTDMGVKMPSGRTQVTARSLQLTYANVMRPGVNSSSWTSEEDARLLTLVGDLGERNWGAVSAALSSPGRLRPPLACAQRWLSRHRRRTQRSSSAAATAAADAVKDAVVAAALVAAVNKSINSQALHLIDWRQVSMLLPGWPKVASVCADCWRSLASDINRFEDWSECERLRLALAVERHGPFKLRRVASFVGTRTELACRQAVEQLVSRDQPAWTYAEDRRLFLLAPQPTGLHDLLSQEQQQQQQQLGGSRFAVKNTVAQFIMREVHSVCWTDFLPQFPGRTASSLVYRWRQLILSSLVWERVKASVDVDGDARRLLLRTPLMAKMLAGGGFLDTGGEGAGPSSMGSVKQEVLSQLLADADEGFLVPRPLNAGAASSRNSLEKLRRDSTAKAALWRPIVSKLSQALNRRSLCPAAREFCRELLLPESEDRLWLTLQTAMEAPKLKERFNKCKTVRQYQAMVPEIVESILSLKPDSKQSSDSGTATAAEVSVGINLNKKRHLGSEESTKPKSKRPRTQPVVGVDLDAENDDNESVNWDNEADVNNSTHAEDDAAIAVDVIDAEVDDSAEAVAKRSLASRIADRLDVKARLLGLPRRRYRLPPVCRVLGDSSMGELLKLRRNCAQKVGQFFRVYLADPTAPPLPLTLSTASAFRRLLASREQLLRRSLSDDVDEDDDVGEAEDEDDNVDWRALERKFRCLFAWPAVLSGMSFADCRARAPNIMRHFFDEEDSAAVVAAESEEDAEGPAMDELLPATHLTARLDGAEMNRGGGNGKSRAAAVSSMEVVTNPAAFLEPKPRNLVPANSAFSRNSGKLNERRLKEQRAMKNGGDNASPTKTRGRSGPKKQIEFLTDALVGDFQLDSVVGVALANGEMLTVPSELVRLIAEGYRPHASLLPSFLMQRQIDAELQQEAVEKELEVVAPSQPAAMIDLGDFEVAD